MAVKRSTAAVLAGLAVLLAGATSAMAATKALEPKAEHFPNEALLKFDQASLQRGYKVYQEVCSACHSMNLVNYRNLAQKGGPFYSAKYPNPNNSPYAKALAAAVMVPDLDPDTGDAVMRKATPADHFRSPFANEIAAKAANGGAAPPDLSVIVKAREGGARYIYSILTGYDKPPAGLTVPAGGYFNSYFPSDVSAAWSGPKDKVPPGGFIKMPFQLTPNRVSFDDGTKSTTEQEAHDVVAFLTWASEPTLEERKQTGLGVMIYLIIFAGLMYLSYRRIWRNIAH